MIFKGIQLESKRLRIFPLDHEQLSYLVQGRSHLKKALGLAPGGFVLDEEIEEEIAEALGFWYEATALHPQDFPWFTNWEVVHKAENRSIGGVSLGGISSLGGSVQIGFFLDKRYQRKGYATEALQAVIAWGWQDVRLDRFVAKTAPNNIPSHRLLKRLGFARVSQQAGIWYWELNRS